MELELNRENNKMIEVQWERPLFSSFIVGKIKNKKIVYSRMFEAVPLRSRLSLLCRIYPRLIL